MNYNLSVVDFLFVCLLIYACYRSVRPFWLTVGKSQCMNDNTVAGILAFDGPRTGTGTQSIGRKWLAFTQQCKGISRQLLAAVLFDQTELWHFRFGNKTGKVLLIINNIFFFFFKVSCYNSVQIRCCKKHAWSRNKNKQILWDRQKERDIFNTEMILGCEAYRIT